MKSWKTTGAGIGGLLAIIGVVMKQLTDGDPTTNPDWNMVVPLVFTSLVGLFPRDNNVTSEQAGVNKPQP